MMASTPFGAAKTSIKRTTLAPICTCTRYGTLAFTDDNVDLFDRFHQRPFGAKGLADALCAYVRHYFFLLLLLPFFVGNAHAFSPWRLTAVRKPLGLKQLDPQRQHLAHGARIAVPRQLPPRFVNHARPLALLIPALYADRAHRADRRQ